MPDRSPEKTQELGDLAERFDGWTTPEPGENLLHNTLALSSALLREPVPESTHATIPTGFKRELAKLLAVALPPLALVVAWNAFVILQLPDVLSRWLPAWLPEGLAFALPAAYVLGAAGWVALVFGSLPVVAHRRAWHRTHEVLT